MKTLLFTLEYPPFKGGIAHYYSNLVKYWPKKDNIFVLNNNDGSLLSFKFFPKWFSSFFVLNKTIHKNKIEHIIVGHILPLGTVVFFLSRFYNFKYSVILHGMDLEYALKNSRKKFLAKLILKNADTIISTNSYVEKKVLKFLGDKYEEKSFIVHPGLSLDDFSYDIKEQKAFLNFRKKYDLDHQFVLFTLGRLVKRKGQDKTIKAVRDLKEHIPDLHYYIAGEGKDEKYLKDLAQDLDYVHFLGLINEEEKKMWMKNCDIFIMPSRNIKGDVEGFGIVYLEAGLAGKAVVAGRSGGVEDAVLDYETGILVDADNPDSIYDAVLELYRDFDLRAELAYNGMKRVLSSFLWKEQARKFFNYINRNF